MFSISFAAFRKLYRILIRSTDSVRISKQFHDGKRKFDEMAKDIGDFFLLLDFG
tara:strand:- start:4456 stop:4617 length:162 start_codon:yes stop_codon:yes gene_type:complete